MTTNFWALFDHYVELDLDLASVWRTVQYGQILFVYARLLYALRIDWEGIKTLHTWQYTYVFC